MQSGTRTWQNYVRDAQVRTVDGIDLCVYSFGDTRRDEVVFGSLTKALRLIQRVQPWRMNMLPRHINRILSVYPFGAEYVPAIRACVIGYKALEDGRVQQIAESIVHELTHGRIENCGVEYTNETRARIEHLCVKAELNFTRESMAAPRVTRSQVPALTPWWTEEHRVQRIVDQLRELGAPEWIISAAMVIYRAKGRLLMRIGLARPD